MARISEDLLTEIFSRLPVKSLMRFKCVSKRWYSLISNPGFAKLHLSRATKTNDHASCQKIIKNFPTQSIDYEAFDRDDDDLKDGKEAVRLLSFPSYDPEKDGGILIGSCDGLVCLSLEHDFILCNPCTGTSRKFQNSGLIPKEETVSVSHFWGFGYDYTSNDYKILHGATFSDVSKESIAVVFSPKNNSWTRISHENADGAFEGGVYLDGALHWYVRRKDGDHKLDSILSFDFADEKFKNVLPAPKADNGFPFEDLGVHEGHLFIYSVCWQDRFEAWIMKEYGNGNSSWIKWFDVSTDGLPWSEFYVKLIACTKRGKMVCQIDEREMIVFNPEDQTFKNIPVELNDGFQPMATYTESLISPFD